jgi:hypothetical protein
MGPAGGPVADPYGALIELAEREREQIAARDYEALGETAAAREALMAELPEVAPEDAHDAIRRLVELQKGNEAAVECALSGIEVELARLRSGRAGVRRYAPGGAAPAKRLDYSA